MKLPGAVVENGQEKAQYDIASGEMTLHLPKETRCEHFADLHLLTTLMTNQKKPQSQRPAGPLISEIGPETADPSSIVIEHAPADADILGHKYGFAQQYSGYFVGFDEMGALSEMIQVEYPEQTFRTVSEEERYETQRAVEEMCFDEDYYIGDLVAVAAIEEVLGFKQPWSQDDELNSAFGKLNVSGDMFTNDDRETMISLSSKQFTFENDDSHKRHVLGLVSILYSYSYTMRSLDGEISPESLFMIAVLSPTLSVFLLPKTRDELIETLIRRTITFPIYRSVAVLEKCIDDVAELLTLPPGHCKSWVTKIMLHLVRAFRFHEDAWRLASVWLEDYAIWVQTAPNLEGELRELGEWLKQVQINKDEIDIGGWNLAGLEALAEDAEELESDNQSESSYDDASESDVTDEEYAESSSTISTATVDSILSDATPKQTRPLIQMLD